LPDNAQELIERDIYDRYCRWLKDVRGQADASLRKKGIEVRMLFQWLRDHATAVPSLCSLAVVYKITGDSRASSGC